MKKKTSIVELVISDENEALTIDAISLVTSPAIEQDFVYFSKEKNNLTFAKVDEEKRELISPALIPNKQIFRYDPNTDSEYYVYFSKETVKKASHLYLKHNNHHKATEQHTDRVSGVLTIESWIKEGEQDKSNLYGFDLPIGTWFVKMKIENDEVWSKIKDGTLKGLSIEGYFTNKFEQMNKKQPTQEQILSALNELIRENKTELKAEKVELGVADDLKNIVSDAKRIIGLQEDGFKWGEKAETQFKEVKKVISDAEGITRGAIRQAGTLKKESDKILNKIEVQAKELGVPVNDVKGYNEANKLINEMFENQNALNGWNEMLKKIL